MAHFTPTYYSSFQDTVSSLCKTMLHPFSLKNRRLPSDQKLANRHSDNLKWQQESFHRILHLINLHKEGMVSSNEVAAFRSHLLGKLTASPSHHESPDMIRDKLLFLKELVTSNCISMDEYHVSKRPLLHRLAAQGGEMETRDVIVGGPEMAVIDEEWSEIDLRDKENQVEKDPKHRSFGLKSLIGKTLKGKGKDGRRKPFGALFHNEQQDDQIDKREINPTSSKNQLGIDGFKKRKKVSFVEEEKDAVRLNPIGEGPNTKRIKNKIHSDGSSSDFFIDKVLGENIKKELARIQSELSERSPTLNFSEEQMEVISRRLPVDKTDLKEFFPKSWCDRHGDVVLDVVKKEFKDHVGEMENQRIEAREKQGDWGSFERNNENLYCFKE